MPRSLPASFADVYSAVADDLQRRIGDAQAATLGPPASVEVVPANDDLRRQRWTEPHPEATDEAMLAFGQEKYQEHLARGLDPEKAQRALAEDLTHFRYRGRVGLYTHGQVGWKDQVKEAKRLKRLAEQEPDDADDAPTPQAGTPETEQEVSPWA